MCLCLQSANTPTARAVDLKGRLAGTLEQSEQPTGTFLGIVLHTGMPEQVSQSGKRLQLYSQASEPAGQHKEGIIARPNSHRSQKGWGRWGEKAGVVGGGIGRGEVRWCRGFRKRNGSKMSLRPLQRETHDTTENREREEREKGIEGENKRKRGT